MVSLRGQDIRRVPLADAVRQLKLVPQSRYEDAAAFAPTARIVWSPNRIYEPGGPNAPGSACRQATSTSYRLAGLVAMPWT